MVWLTPLSLPHVLCLLVHFHKAARFSGIKKEIRALSSLPNTPVPRITGSEVKCQHLTIVSGTLCGLRFAFLTLTPLPIVFSPPHYPEIHGLLMFPEDNVKLFPMIESLSLRSSLPRTFYYCWFLPILQVCPPSWCLLFSWQFSLPVISLLYF